MAFKIVKKLSGLKWPVTVKVPTDGGKVSEQEFTAIFEILPKTQYNEMLKTSKSDTEFMRAFLIGWEGLLDDDGKDLPFNEENLETLTEFSFVRTAIIAAYNAAATGQAEKN